MSTANKEQLSIKDLLAIIPQFHSPAKIWAQKINLIYSTTNATLPNIIEVIKLRLPSHIFEVVAEQNFTSVHDLLDKINTLDGPSQNELHSQIFENRDKLQSDQLPSSYFRMIFGAAKISLPSLDEKQASEIAWKKLFSTLPNEIQNILQLSQNEKFSSSSLDRLDTFWRNCNSVIPKAAILNKIDDSIVDKLSNLSIRLDGIEAAIQNNNTKTFNRPTFSHHRKDSVICWYHQRFGNYARKCIQPCQFQKPKNLN